MAHIYRNRPDGLADPTELMVAEKLSELDDRWQIIWGYFFEDPGLGSLVYEGDFIIQGPHGQVLVMEVKGGQNRQFLLTGHWEGSDNGDNPLEQLNREWKAVLGKMQDKADHDPCPWVGRALCTPNLNKIHADRLADTFGGSLLITRDDLLNFEGWWKHHMEVHRSHAEQPQRIFQRAFLQGNRPAPFDLFIKETDRILDRYRSSSRELLDMLRANPGANIPN